MATVLPDVLLPVCGISEGLKHDQSCTNYRIQRVLEVASFFGKFFNGVGVDGVSSGASGGSIHRGASFKVEKAHFAA